jgi:hypothetical protein
MMLFYNKGVDVYALYLPKALERTLVMIVNENIFILMIKQKKKTKKKREFNACSRVGIYLILLCVCLHKYL